MKQYNFSSKKKDRKKLIRSILQGICLVFLLYITVSALFSFTTYVYFNDGERTQIEDGFIAISYFGVDRSESETLISTKNLEKHIKALKASGYVTITQEDIKNYYEKSQPLPQKSLFLIFEDGRRDTVIFAQKILEEYNYKGNIFSYAENLEGKSSKFLSASDLHSLQKNSFWEIGTNGYRLSYINVFDRYGNFFDQLDTNEFQMLSSYVDRNYNHYLMDYIRDEYGIPVENFDEMKERIIYDYKRMKEIYTNAIGRMPRMYALMHSNTGQFGSNNNVSSVNEAWIKELFDMNFNREGNSRNQLDTSIYNLSRIQPQAYWSTNHLLMRIWADTNHEVAFVSGDLEKKKDWHIPLGVAKFVDDTITLTSLPRDKGLMFLKDSHDYKDISLSVNIKGNKVGAQGIYLRADQELDQYILVQIRNNILYVYEKKAGSKKEEFSLDLDIHDEIKRQSLEENKLESEIRYLETQIRYADNLTKSKELTLLLNEKKRLQSKSIEEGAEEYIPRIDIREPGNRLIDITLKEDTLSLYVDNKKVFGKMEVSIQDPGYIGLESSFSDYGYSQRNIFNTVYDGVFKELIIKEAFPLYKDLSKILWSNQLTGFENFKCKIKAIWENTLNWFIKYL